MDGSFFSLAELTCSVSVESFVNEASDQSLCNCSAVEGIRVYHHFARDILLVYCTLAYKSLANPRLLV
jgi:hypothetical protein